MAQKRVRIQYIWAVKEIGPEEKKKEKKEIISSQKESSIIFLYYSIFYDVSGNVCTSSIRRRLVLVLRHDQVENTREAVHTTQYVT